MTVAKWYGPTQNRPTRTWPGGGFVRLAYPSRAPRAAQGLQEEGGMETELWAPLAVLCLALLLFVLVRR